MNPIREYYNQIIDGEIVVSDRVRRIYKHLVDKLENPSQYIYDKDRAEVAIDFIELFCKHSKGKWAGKPVILELWQKAMIAALFGFVDKDTKARQYQELILIVARKNGKSTVAAAIGLFCWLRMVKWVLKYIVLQQSVTKQKLYGMKRLK